MQSLETIKQLVIDKYANTNIKRLNHTLGVCDMAVKLANIYNVDPIKAEIAALLHDYCKYDDFTKANLYLNKEELEECKIYPFLYHPYLAANFYINNIGNDIDIYNAIKYHVFGRLNMSRLEEIIMISDYTEMNRVYDSCIKCREILFDKGINEAIVYSLEQTIKNCLDNNLAPHPKQLEILKEYKNKI